MPSFKIKHITRYSYNTPAMECTNQIMLYPLQDTRQNLVSHKLTITRSPKVETFYDYFGNKMGMFSIVEPHDELLISSEIEVITQEVAIPSDDTDTAKQWAQLHGKAQPAFVDFMQQETFDEEDAIKDVIRSIFNPSKSPFENAKLFNTYIYNNFEYKKGITSVETGIDEIWNLKAGVCQDFAHMLLVILRKIGIPARYVSGYSCPLNHELRGEGATHAWVEAYLPDYGWIGLDPTNNCVANDLHVRLAVGRNFADVTPVKGTYKGSSEHSLDVLVLVTNLDSPVSDTQSEQPELGIKFETPTKPKENNSYRFYMEQMQQQQQQ